MKTVISQMISMDEKGRSLVRAAEEYRRKAQTTTTQEREALKERYQRQAESEIEEARQKMEEALSQEKEALSKESARQIGEMEAFFEEQREALAQKVAENCIHSGGEC